METQVQQTSSPLIKPAVGDFSLHPPIRERWSGRAFSDEPVNPEIIGSLLEAARWAPSSMNAQPWRFVVATKDQPEAYNHLFDSLSEKNQRWAGQAPVLILAVSKTEFDGGYGRNSYAEYDVGQAVAYLTIQATSMGLNLHQMGGFSKEQVRNSLDLPDGYEPMTLTAVGYPGDPEQLPSAFREREKSPRSRLSLNEIASYGDWKRSIEELFNRENQYWR